MSSTPGTNFDGVGLVGLTNEIAAGGLPDELGPEEFDGLLNPNVLETLADL